MRTLRLILHLLSAVMLMWPSAQAQDIHFSQVDIDPILSNPSYTGFFDGSGRFGLAYRNQWASVTNAFQTLTASAEVALTRRRYQRDGLNIGVYLYRDVEGELRYGTNLASASLSYFVAVSGDRHFISVGLEGGYGQLGFDLTEARFEESGDDIASRRVIFPTIGAGMAWFYNPSDNFYTKVGIAAHNINRPNISFMGVDDTYREPRFNVYWRSELRQWATFSLLPIVAAQHQHNYNELLMGMDAKWYISESRTLRLAFTAGLYYRWRDALMLPLSVEYNAFIFALCYDANLSKLTPASKSVGSFELQTVYLINPQKTVKRKALPCPII